MSDPGSISLSAINASFDRYAENQFSAVYKLEAWCPTADLLALVSSENRLELFRLSWNQHWSMPVQRDIVSGNASTIPRYGSGTLPQGLRTAATTSTAGSAHADVVSLVWRPDGNKRLDFKLFCTVDISSLPDHDGLLCSPLSP
jgi:hypothetical protein